MNHPLLLLLSNALSLHTCVILQCVVCASLLFCCADTVMMLSLGTLCLRSLLLTCLILLVCVCASLLGACVAGPGAERGEFGTPA